uniref:U-homostoxin-Hdu1a n=1 Tax=Homostichanthus duerdeni TaxID=1301368 RepID=BBH1A_HOMDU|nr:RecName: Full=U-homostoxin-Hdu1a; Short=U-HMTX-Hdu1a; AltName: Full=Peptide U-SHTX-Sdd1 [Homostichanthus duerdeni]
TIIGAPCRKCEHLDRSGNCVRDWSCGQEV